MFRRIVAIFVIVGFIASQWLALPHAHGATAHASEHSHSTAPHIHLSWFCEGHPHEHGHPHGNCDHEHDESGTAPASSFVDGLDHDADAFYLSSETSHPGSNNRDSHSSLDVTKVLLAVATISDNAAELGLVTYRQYPPEFRAPNCALYLQLRTLRI